MAVVLLEEQEHGGGHTAGHDALKRTLMTFGSPLNLALHDKVQRQVSSAAGAECSPDPRL